MNVVNDLRKVGYMIIYEIDDALESTDCYKLSKVVKQKLHFGEPSAQSIVKFNIKDRATQNNEVYPYNNRYKLLKVK